MDWYAISIEPPSLEIRFKKLPCVRYYKSIKVVADQLRAGSIVDKAVEFEENDGDFFLVGVVKHAL